jgi:hypothetical protein
MTTTETLPAAAFKTLEAFRAFLLAGHALFTIVSKRTGARKTFKVEQAKGEEKKGLFFVKLLVGPSNTQDYKFLGSLYVKTARDAAADFASHPALGWKLNKQNWGVESSAAVEWIVKHLNTVQDTDLLDHAEIWHEGRCGKCGRVLTDPTSISSGLGPVCAGRN